jgi:hypothetical protein
VLIQLSMAVVIYFWCYLTVPEVHGEGTIDLAAHFWKQRRALYATALAVCAVSFVDNLEFLKTPFAGGVVLSNAIDVLLAVPAVFALLSPARWVQWLCGVSIFVMDALFFAIFFWKLT